MVILLHVKFLPKVVSTMPRSESSIWTAVYSSTMIRIGETVRFYLRFRTKGRPIVVGHSQPFTLFVAMEKLTNRTDELINLSVQDLLNSMLLIDPVTILNKKERKEYPLRTFSYTSDHGVRYDFEFVGMRNATDPPKEPERFFRIKGYVKMPTNEELIIAVLHHHPVPICFTMTYTTFQALCDLEEGEIFRPLKITDENWEHSLTGQCVLLVGYFTKDDENYLVFLNSWGEDWGDHGYGTML